MSEETKPWPRWSVKQGAPGISKKTNAVTEATHRLLYCGVEQNSAKGVSGLNAMNKQADFMNSRKLTPNPPVSCLADLDEGARKRICIKRKA
jgi:hypothetical protein